jgi:hypothetical protein
MSGKKKLRSNGQEFQAELKKKKANSFNPRSKGEGGIQ